MMKYNLDEIPEKFHILFNSDWNNGNESEMTSTHRGNLNELYLEYNKYQIKKSIQEKRPVEVPLQGGFDDLELFS